VTQKGLFPFIAVSYKEGKASIYGYFVGILRHFEAFLCVLLKKAKFALNKCPSE
jgi:hypothetical protein